MMSRDNPLLIRRHRAPELTDERHADCLFMLEHYDATEMTDPALNKPLASGFAGSAYSQNSPCLTPRQLIGAWRQGRLCFPAYRDEYDVDVNTPFYLIGCGGSLLSGDWLGWGIDPIHYAIVLGDGALLPPGLRRGFISLWTTFNRVAVSDPHPSTQPEG